MSQLNHHPDTLASDLPRRVSSRAGGVAGLLGTMALAVAAASAGRLLLWYRRTVNALGAGMVVDSAAMPLVRGLALRVGLSTYLFLVVTSVVLVSRRR